MPDFKGLSKAAEPEDLDRLFLQRANAGDVEGVVALYEPNAVLSFPPGQLAIGAEQIRAVYDALLADRPTFGGTTRPAIRYGDLALTSTTRQGNATAEVARRQPDGTWRWIIVRFTPYGGHLDSGTAGLAVRMSACRIGSGKVTTRSTAGRRRVW